jgi:peptide/nickel transport system permease protein
VSDIPTSQHHANGRRSPASPTQAEQAETEGNTAMGSASAPIAATLIKTPLYVRALRALRAIWRALTSNPKVAIGSAIIGFFVLVALIGPFFMPYDPHLQSPLIRGVPSSAHLLGTTQLGEDVFSQLVYGARASVFWGLGTGLAVTFLSITIGLVSGYFGGFVDDLLTLLTNVFLVLPPLPLAIALSSYFERGAFTVAVVITFTSWAWGARLLRAQTLSVRNREFVTAAQASGEKTWRIIFFEIFPNEISIVAANFVSTTLYVVIAIASLEFLGLGDLTSVSWGSMLYWSQKTNALLLGSWWWFVPPGLCIAFLGAGLALINFGIDEVADPRLRAVRMPKLRRKKGPESALETVQEGVA